MFGYIIYLWRSPFAKIVSDYIIMTRAPVAAVRYICPSYKFSMKLFIDDFEQINTYMYVMYVYDECWFANRQFVQTSQLSRFHRLSHGLTVGSSFFKGLQILSGFFPKLTVFWKKKKHTQAAHSNAAKELISRMINKNKTSSRSSLSLSWKLLFTKLVKRILITQYNETTIRLAENSEKIHRTI